MKGQFVLTHSIRQTEFPALLDSWVTNTPSVKMLCPQKIFLSLHFRQNKTCLFGVLRIGQVLCVSCKTVYRWITTNGCLMSDIFSLKNNYFVRI
jgi:hypothetical protein